MDVFLFFVVLMGFVSLAFHFKHPAKPKDPPTKAVPPSPCIEVKEETTATQTPRFDTESARPVEEPRVLFGAAYIIDGDTIKITCTQVRLFGIDAPELNHPYGKKAKWALHKLCKNQKIRAAITEQDEYGRTVARCYLEDGRDLSAEMVKLGLAIDWPKFSGGKYRSLETSDARKKLFLADARQKGRMHVWEKFESRQQS